MRKILKSLFSRKKIISKETQETIDLLKQYGVEISIVTEENQFNNEYILGKMSDKYSVCR